MSDRETTLADTEKLGKSSISPPLADPILKLIFESVHAGGLAGGEPTQLFSIRAIPRLPRWSAPRIRKSRKAKASGAAAIDVEALTEDGETILIEARLSSFTGMSERALLHAQKRLDAKSKTGETLPNAIKKIPRIIALTLLDFALRESEEDFHQIVEAAYRAPRQAAVPRIAIHRLQLPKVPRNRS